MSYGQQMIDRLLMQFSNSPNLHGVLNVLGTELDLLKQVFNDLQERRWIDTGEGQQLDGCGVIVNQPRRIDNIIPIPFFGFVGQIGSTGFNQGRIRRRRESYLSSADLADPEYRKMLWARVAKNTTNGTTESTIDSLRRLYNAKIILTEPGNAKMRIAIGRELTIAEMLLVRELDLFVRAGGVGMDIHTWFIEGNTFGFSNPAQGYKGFGQGRLAKKINWEALNDA